MGERILNAIRDIANLTSDVHRLQKDVESLRADVNNLLKQMAENTFELQRMRDAMAHERKEAETERVMLALRLENMILRAGRELPTAPPQTQTERD